MIQQIDITSIAEDMFFTIPTRVEANMHKDTQKLPRLFVLRWKNISYEISNWIWH